MAGIADRLCMDGKQKDLRLGDTFNKGYKSSGAAYHTIRYDFKPQSIDTQKMGTVEIVENHEVTVTVPHREGSGQSQTVFKGNEKPVAKECLLIIDHVTGEIVLERLSSHITVKKTREEGSSRMNSHRPPTPLNQSHKNSPPQKASPSHNSRGGATGSSPSRSRPSPSHHMKVSPPSKMSPHRSSSSVPSKSPSSSFMPTMGSMPMLGMEAPNVEAKAQETSIMSDSSSSDSSGSSSSSDSDSDSEPDNPPPKKANGHSGAPAAINLNDDLELSEDDSD